jgi:hypothetical protein
MVFSLAAVFPITSRVRTEQPAKASPTAGLGASEYRYYIVHTVHYDTFITNETN